MSRTLLEVENLWAGYGGEAVVCGISFSVRAGSLVALVGPNGAGKTTIAKTIAGLIKPIKGRITRRVPMGYVPQHKGVETAFPLTLRQFVATGAYPQTGLLRALRTDEMLDEVLQRLGLREHAEKTLAQLSGGTLRKAMVARALVQKPPLLLLDEPNAELDADSERELFAILADLKKQGHGILFISPKQAAIPEAEVTLHLDRGSIVEKEHV